MSAQPSHAPLGKVISPLPGSPELDEVIKLGRTAKATASWMRDAAFVERAIRRTLLAVQVDGQIAAYAMYGLPRDEVRLDQLVVARDFRGRGLARRLVDEVARAHPSRRGIVLHCRNDFPAARLWDKLGFVPVSERPGRSLDGKPLTRWYRSFGQPDLFTDLQEQDTRPVAVLDACSFYEVIATQPEIHAEQLAADHVGEHARLAVADQLLVEINRDKNAARRRERRVAASPLRLASGTTNGWESLLAQLREAHPDAPSTDTDDLTHLAQAMACGAGWLITGDRRFVRRYGKTSARISATQIVSPDQFLRDIDELAHGEQYRPVELADTEVTSQIVDATTLPTLAPDFVNHQEGERIRAFRATISRLASRPQEIRLETIQVDGVQRGLVCWQVRDDAVDVLLARATAGPGESTIARHLLAMMRNAAVAADVPTVRVLDASPSLSIRARFRDEGFARNADDIIVAHPLRGKGTLAELHARALELGSPLATTRLFAPEEDDLTSRAAEAERWFAPFIVLGADIPTYYVPIRHGWATQLVDVGLAEEQLLARTWQLGLRRELVYYRSVRNSRGIAAPARLVWYVSGTAQGAGNVRAMSHLMDVQTDAPERLFQRFAGYGVYSLQDVIDVAGDGDEAMALKFTATRRIGPVPTGTYRDLMEREPLWASVHRMSEHVFVQLLDHDPADAA